MHAKCVVLQQLLGVLSRFLCLDATADVDVRKFLLFDVGLLNDFPVLSR